MLMKILVYETEMLADTLFAVLFQYGYLTIKNYDEGFQTYQLGIPNNEIGRNIMSINSSQTL